MKDSHLEHCWIITGQIKDQLWWGRLRRMTKGTPCNVNFDYDYALKREEAKHDFIGMMHTHPTFLAMPSSRDHRTMRAWYNCFGKSLLCLIKGTDGLRAYRYDNDEDPPSECQVKRVGNLVFGSTADLHDAVVNNTLDEYEDEITPELPLNLADYQTILKKYYNVK